MLHAKGARQIIVEVVLAVGVLTAVAIVVKEVVNPSVRLEIAEVPQSLEANGFTDVAAASLVRGELRSISDKARSALRNLGVIDFREPPKIIVPGTDLGVSDLANQIRRFLGVEAPEISVYIEQRGNQYVTRVLANRSVLPMNISWRPAKDTEDIVAHVAQEIARLTQPEALVAYLSDTYRGEQCLKLVDEIQRTLPHDDAAYIRSQLVASIVLSKRKQFSQAISKIRSVLAVDPAYAPAHNILGNVYFDMKDYGSARRLYMESIKLDPSDPIPPINLAYSYQVADEFEKAIFWYRKAIDVNASTPEAYYLLAESLTAMNRLEEAVAASRRAIALREPDEDFHWQLSKELRLLGRLQEAEAECHRAEELDKTHKLESCWRRRPP